MAIVVIGVSHQDDIYMDYTLDIMVLYELWFGKLSPHISIARISNTEGEVEL